MLESGAEKEDPMPSFKDKLTADEIPGAVWYIREFAKKK